MQKRISNRDWRNLRPGSGILPRLSLNSFRWRLATKSKFDF